MKPYIKPGDENLKFPRRLGTRRYQKAAMVAKCAPEQLDGVQESTVHDLLEGEILAAGWPYLSFRENVYFWLKRMAERHWQARELLDGLKDFPDLTVFKPEPGKPWARCLPLELKRAAGRGSKGQRSLAETINGTIAKGYQQGHDALNLFLEAP